MVLAFVGWPSARMRPAQVSFTPAPGYHAAWMQQQQKTRAKPRARTSPPPPPPVFEIPTQNRFWSCGPPCWHERHQAEADRDPEEGLQPGGAGTHHIVHDEDHRVRTTSHVPARNREVQ
ncbi:hypothetical protein QTP86_012621 [Hemibagrus guttatus]|nr:hypothetical protein QTP86_012621 [Hemibagrus guttatus]